VSFDAAVVAFKHTCVHFKKTICIRIQTRDSDNDLHSSCVDHSAQFAVAKYRENETVCGEVPRPRRIQIALTIHIVVGRLSICVFMAVVFLHRFVFC